MRMRTGLIAAAAAGLLAGFLGGAKAQATSVRRDSCPKLAGLWQCVGPLDIFQNSPADPEVPYPVKICVSWRRKGSTVQPRQIIWFNCGAETDEWARRASVFFPDGKTREIWSVESPHTGRLTIKSHASCLAGDLTATHRFYSAVEGVDTLSMESRRTFKITKGPGGKGPVLEVLEQERSPEDAGMVIEVERKATCKPAEPAPGGPS